MADGYVAPEVAEWMERMRTVLPPTAPISGGADAKRDELIDEISEYFAHHMSTGPDFSRAVTENVQDAVRRFNDGDGDAALRCLLRAHQALVAFENGSSALQ